MFSIIKIWYTNNNDRKGGDRMKEAAGEANMTVITIILIGIVLAVGTVIVNGMLSGIKEKTECVNNGGVGVNGQCDQRGAGTNIK